MGTSDLKAAAADNLIWDRVISQYVTLEEYEKLYWERKNKLAEYLNGSDERE